MTEFIKRNLMNSSPQNGNDVLIYSPHVVPTLCYY